MSSDEADFERKMDVARRVMERRKVVLSVLAQGDASPYLTDEFKAQLVEAGKQIEKYTVKARSQGQT